MVIEKRTWMSDDVLSAVNERYLVETTRSSMRLPWLNVRGPSGSAIASAPEGACNRLWE
jgi:hypothetical protein